MGYVITASDPTSYANSALTTAYSSSRSNPSPPIGLGFAPIQYDTAQFAYQNLSTGNTTTIVKQYDGAGWTSVVGNVISGGLFVPGSINANTLNANQVYALTIASTNAESGNIASRGFWLESGTGDARFAGNTTIGNNLVIGQDAQIGANLTVGTNLTVGNNATIGGFATIGSNVSVGANLTVGNNAVIGGFATVGSNVRVGGNLTVGNNTVIGGNLNVSGLVTGGNLQSNTVSTTTITLQSVSQGVGISTSNRVTINTPTNNTLYSYVWCKPSITTSVVNELVYVTGTLNSSVYIFTGGSYLATYSLYKSGTGLAGNVLLSNSTVNVNNTGGTNTYYYFTVPFAYVDNPSATSTGVPGTWQYFYTVSSATAGSFLAFDFYQATMTLQGLKR
jgi:acetyltransferase-like isoleucine patch superfamily enzyme